MPTKLLTGQADLASGEAAEAKPDGHSSLVAQLRRPRLHLPDASRQLPIVICHSQDLTQ